MKPLVLVLCSLLTLATAADAKTHRDRSVTRDFQKTHPCPSTGKTKGACPGYIKDHRIPLCRGGADAVSNLQWQSKAEAKAKDRVECRR